MEVFTFVVRDGAVIDLHSYLQEIAALGVSHSDLQRLKLRIAEVSGVRRAVIDVAHGTAALSLRPLPARPSEITMDSTPIRDARRFPARRGADLGWQHRQLMSIHADEGVLVDDRGAVVSSITSPLVMIKEGTAHVSAHPRTADSIALEGVVAILEQRGVPVRRLEEGFSLRELRANEVWVVNSLYGASLVRAWLEYGTAVPARTPIDRMGVPTHREINQLRLERLEQV